MALFKFNTLPFPCPAYDSPSVACTCVVSSQFNFIILGDTFLRTYYTVFDSERQVIRTCNWLKILCPPPLVWWPNR